MSAGRLGIIGLFLALGGCAAAMPGYVPPSDKTDRIKAQAPRGGGFDAAGTYSLTEQEQALDCKSLTGSMTIKILQMRDSATRTRPSTTAAIAQSTVRPLTGGTAYGADIDADLARDRARLETMNRRLAEKNCRTFDLAAELAPGTTAVPRPVGEAAKPKQR
jgi:hypothetical protein